MYLFALYNTLKNELELMSIMIFAKETVILLT